MNCSLSATCVVSARVVHSRLDEAYKEFDDRVIERLVLHGTCLLDEVIQIVYEIVVEYSCDNALSYAESR